jgi:hypothetical protein
MSTGLEPSLRRGMPQITHTSDGGLAVNGEPVIQEAAFPSGLVALITLTGVALLHREEPAHWHD